MLNCHQESGRWKRGGIKEDKKRKSLLSITPCGCCIVHNSHVSFIIIWRNIQFHPQSFTRGSILPLNFQIGYFNPITFSSSSYYSSSYYSSSSYSSSSSSNMSLLPYGMPHTMFESSKDVSLCYVSSTFH